MKLNQLFKPITIRTMVLANRIVMPAIGTNFASVEGATTERLIDYYSARAKGGVALIIVEATCVDSPVGKLAPIQLCIDDDKFITGLHELAESIHINGAKTAIQLSHAGRQTNLANTGGIDPVSSSTVPCPSRGGEPRALTVNEIERIARKYAQAAGRAKAAGFDAVEIHGGHGWLIAQFLSPYTNKRTDDYGGSLDGRLKFALEVLRLSRETVGEDFPIIFKLSGDEYVKGGLALRDTLLMVDKLEEAGADAFHVSAGLAESGIWTVQPMALPRGCLTHLAEGFKKKSHVPVIAVGRINDPELAERILLENKADLIAMGRALVADPELPRKAAEGRTTDICRCIACNIGCDMYFGRRWPITCTVNAAVGKERRYAIKTSRSPKKVLVVGGGPAGMEAARVAALRGHDVTLCERNSELGGQLLLASRPPHKEELLNLIEFLTNQLRKTSVRVLLDTEISQKIVETEHPDVIIAATGSKPFIPPIGGVNQEKVTTAWDILSGTLPPEQNIAIIGGGTVGCETAEFLAQNGRTVAIVSRSEDIALDMEGGSRHLLKKRLQESGVRVVKGVDVERITNSGLLVRDGTGVVQSIPAQMIVLARGSTPNRTDIELLKSMAQKFYMIGDCVAPRGILEAISDGAHVGRRI